MVKAMPIISRLDSVSERNESKIAFISDRGGAAVS